METNAIFEKHYQKIYTSYLNETKWSMEHKQPNCDDNAYAFCHALKYPLVSCLFNKTTHMLEFRFATVKIIDPWTQEQ